MFKNIHSFIIIIRLVKKGVTGKKMVKRSDDTEDFNKLRKTWKNLKTVRVPRKENMVFAGDEAG